MDLGKQEPTQETRMGRMLAAGRVTATMRSKKSGQHITLTLQVKAKVEGKWETVNFSEASHVFIKYGHGDFGAAKVGTYYPKTGKIYFDSNDKAWRYAALHILRAAQTGEQDTSCYTIQEEERCARCAHELSDPISIAIGLGPDCEEHVYGTRTPRGEHYTQDEANLIVSEKFGGKPSLVEQLASAARVLGREGRTEHPATQPAVDAINAEVEARRDAKGRTLPRTFAELAASVKS